MLSLALSSATLPLAELPAAAHSTHTIRADVPGEELVLSEVERLDADREALTGAYPGLIVTPHHPLTYRDGKYSQSYGAVAYAYRARLTPGDDGKLQVTGYARRFAVHAPDAASLPLAQRVARLLLLIWNTRRARLFPDHSASQPTLDVWLTRQTPPDRAGDIGGEQFKNQIYLYNVSADRSPTEWLREVAHEYGHYALPGVSGYTSPEEWANGVLGERLFLQWLDSDLRAGRFAADALPFVTPEELRSAVARQVTPLLRRIAENGVNAASLARQDAPGMDAYTGLAIYIDAVYGSRALLDALSETQPDRDGFTHAPAFLRGTLDALNVAGELTITPPFAEGRTTTTFWLYLPRGKFSVKAAGSLQTWQFAPDPKGIGSQSKTGLVAMASGWRKLTATRTLSAATAAPARLILKKG